MSSEEDEEKCSANQQRKRGCSRLRIVDEEGSSSTGDSAVGDDRRRQRKCRRIESDESEDADLDDSGVNVQSENDGDESSEDEEEFEDDEDRDSDNWEDVNEDAGEEEEAAAESDESDGQSEKCAICLNRFLGQEIGVPESCDHSFCLECLLEWTKKINTCPVDRQVFNLVLVKLELEGKIVRRVPIARPEEEESEADENLTYCEVCGRCDREDRLLLCDACDLGYHCECLDPPLHDIPIEEWYCPSCSPPPSSAEEDEMPGDLLDEFNELLESRFRPQTVRRAIARTRASETVRSRIQRMRTAAVTTEETTVAPRVVKKKRVVRRRRKTRTRKRRRKKSVAAKKSSDGLSFKKKKPRRRRRKRRTRRGIGRTRRAIQAARPLVCPTVKRRIAERLGLQKPPPGHNLPLMRQPGPARGYGVPETGLLLFGDRDELHSFEGVYDEEDGEVSAVRAAAPTYRRSPHKCKDILTRTSVPYPSSFDLLGSILQTQTMLHTNSVNVRIGWDGTLTPSSDKTLHCPLGPDTPSGDPQPDHTHTKSHNQNSSDDHYASAEASACSSAEDNAGECSDGTDSAASQHHRNNDCEPCSPSGNDRSRKQPQNRSPKHNKETNKVSASDDDIDIYSDIESISNDTCEDMYGGLEERCEPSSLAADHQGPSMADSSEDELIIDEAPRPDSEPENETMQITDNGLESPEEVEDVEEEEEQEQEQVSEAEEIDESRDEKNETFADSKTVVLPDLEEDEEEEECEVKSESNDEAAEFQAENLSTELTNVKIESDDGDNRESSNIKADEQEPVTSKVKVAKEATGGHLDEDDVITAKVGSPIWEESEEQDRVNRQQVKLPKQEEIPEEGEIQVEEEEGDMKIENCLEGIEDVSEAGSDDEREMGDEVCDDEEAGADREEGEACDESQKSEEDPEMDDVEAKVAQLFEDESNNNNTKQVESEEDEGLCDSPEEEVVSPAVVQQPTKTTYSSSHHHHHSSVAENTGSRSSSHANRSSREHASDRDFGRGRGSGESGISWKKPSKNTKERSYRDGKPRDERFLYRERELKDKDSNEKSSRKKEDVSGGCRHTRKEEERSRHDKRSSGGKSGVSSSSSSKYKESSSSGKYESSSSKPAPGKYDGSGGSGKTKRHRSDCDNKKWYDKHTSNSEKRASERTASERTDRTERYRGEKTSSSKHKHKEYKYADQYGESDKHYKYEQQQTAQIIEDVAVDKHRHEKRKDREVRKVENKIIVEKKSNKEKKRPTSSDSQLKKKKKMATPPSPVSEEDVSDVESKEIYSKGGSIIINVNYNRSSTGSKDQGKHGSRKVPKQQPSNSAETKTAPVVIHDEDSDSWADTSKAKSGWNREEEDDDEIQIVCEKLPDKKRKKQQKHHPPSPPATAANRKKDKEDAEANKSFDMFWRDVEDISQDAAGKEEPEGTKESLSVGETLQGELGGEESTTTKMERQEQLFQKLSPPSLQADKSGSTDSLTFSGIFKRQPRSPSPPSPSDDESYDPCEPTRSPSPVKEEKKDVTVAVEPPKPPPEPIRPPLPLEPEPRQPSPPPMKVAFERNSPSINSAAAGMHFVGAGPPPSAQFPNSNNNSISVGGGNPATLMPSGPMPMGPMPNIRIPPPNFMQPAMGRSAGIQALRPWPMANGPPPMLFQSSQIQHIIRGSFMGPGGLQHSQMGGMMPPPAGSHHHAMAMLRAPLGGPGLLPTPAGSSGGPSTMQQILLPDLSHPPPSMVMQPTFSVGAAIVPNSTVVTSVPISLVAMSVAQQPPSSGVQHHPAKEESAASSTSAAVNVVDMEVESPYSPEEYSPGVDNAPETSSSPDVSMSAEIKRPSTPPKEKDRFDALLEAVPRLLADKKTRELLAVLRPKAMGFKSDKKSSIAAATSTTVAKADSRTKHRHKAAGKRKGIAVKMKESQLKILDELPSSAVEMQVKEKFLKKLNRQERVVEEVKHALKPFYNKRDIDKSEYKSILRKCVPKICHNKTGEINPVKIKGMVEGYVRKYKHHRKKSQKSDS